MTPVYERHSLLQAGVIFKSLFRKRRERMPITAFQGKLLMANEYPFVNMGPKQLYFPSRYHI